jgi:hypothetical protein
MRVVLRVYVVGVLIRPINVNEAQGRVASWIAFRKPGYIDVTPVTRRWLPTRTWNRAASPTQVG